MLGLQLISHLSHYVCLIMSLLERTILDTFQTIWYMLLEVQHLQTLKIDGSSDVLRYFAVTDWASSQSGVKSPFTLHNKNILNLDVAIHLAGRPLEQHVSILSISWIISGFWPGYVLIWRILITQVRLKGTYFTRNSVEGQHGPLFL